MWQFTVSLRPVWVRFWDDKWWGVYPQTLRSMVNSDVFVVKDFKPQNAKYY